LAYDVHSFVIGQLEAMTYEREAEVRKSSVGTKVLGVAVGVLGVLGSFWGVVWFIRSYVEAPRVNAPAPMILASRESIPVPGPASGAEVKSDAGTAPTLAGPVAAAPQPVAAASPPPAPISPVQPVRNAAVVTPQVSEVSPANAIADRWFSGNQLGPPGVAPPPVAPSPIAAVPAAEAQPAPPPEETTAEKTETEGAAEEVAESSVPAIAGPAPLPRRKPVMTAAVKRADVTPMPRPRPDGQVAPQSVWTGVQSDDERFNARD